MSSERTKHYPGGYVGNPDVIQGGRPSICAVTRLIEPVAPSGDETLRFGNGIWREFDVEVHIISVTVPCAVVCVRGNASVTHADGSSVQTLANNMSAYALNPGQTYRVVVEGDEPATVCIQQC